MKIGIDFDGTVVDVKYSEHLDSTAFFSFLSDDCYIVTSRTNINKHFIWKMCDKLIPLNQIICCGSVKEKVEYINNHMFDVFIDNEKDTLNKLIVPLKINIKQFNWKELVFLLREHKLFSPGPVPFKMNIDMNFSHRSDIYSFYYINVKELIKKEFNIPNTYDILFTQGSGTSAVETVLSSLLTPQRNITIFSNGTFGDRAHNIAKFYTKKVKKIDTISKLIVSDIFYYTQFETSQSKYNNMNKALTQCRKNNIITISDSVSALGYYPLPRADIIIASSSKILGGLPAMGIIIYKKKLQSYLVENNDYLSMLQYIKYAKRNQTPHTPLIPQLISVYQSIKERVKPEHIERNCKEITQPLINDKVCPVITLQPDNMKAVLAALYYFQFEIYYNPAYMTDYFQVGMFNYKNNKVYRMMNMIIEAFGK